MLLYMLLFMLLGMVTGSFINVCIYRMPKDESVIAPRSHCPHCNNLICWYDNIPVISYLALKGKCRHCGSTISLQYPLVELLSGICFALVAYRFPLQAVLPLYLYLTFALIAISGIDYYHRIIPDFFSYSLLVLGIVYSPLNGALGTSWAGRLLASCIGAAAGFGILYAIGFVGEMFMKQEVMGGGDIKLLAGVGAIIGWAKVLSTLFVASLLGSIAGIALIFLGRMQRKTYLPFGPFLAMAAFMNLFFPDPWQWLNSSSALPSVIVTILLDKFN